MSVIDRLGSGRTGSDAIVRVLSTFVVFFAVLIGLGQLIASVPTPSILVNLPGNLAAFAGVGAVLAVMLRLFDLSPGAYGLAIDRDWVTDLLGGVVLGVLFQAISTAAILGTDDGMIVAQWDTGVAEGVNGAIVAVTATIIAFFAVALWEELLFRAVLIRELVVGLRAHGVSQSTATAAGVVGSTLLFGILHLGAGASGLSAAVVVLQAVVGGLYFGLAYVLTGSLALPVGIHLSTNLWTTVVFGQPDSGFPAAFRLTRPFDFGADLLVTMLLPAGVLVAAVFGWIRATRGGFPKVTLSHGS